MKAVQSAEGSILHDWHAETLAIRAFNRFLIDECYRMAGNGDCSSKMIERRQSLSSMKQAFVIREDIKIIMYCSEAPCG